MTKITNFNRSTTRMTAEAIEEILNKELKKYGLSVQSRGGRFNHLSYTAKFEISIGGMEDALQRDAEEAAKMLRLSGVNYTVGQKFISNGKTFTVIRFDTKKYKNPVIAKCTDGRTYKMPIACVKMGLK